MEQGSWKQNLYVIWLSQFIAMLGMSLVVPFLPFFLRDLGVSDPDSLARWSGLAFSGPFFISFVATPFWGWVGDRTGRKAMVLRAVLGLGVSQALIGFAQNPEQLLLGRMVQGGISGFIAAAMALVASTTPKERLGVALGTLQTATATGTVLGPLVGGVLADFLGFRAIFWVTSGFCFASGLLVLWKVKEPPESRGNHTGPLWDNYRVVLTTPLLLGAAAAVFLTQCSMGLVQAVFALVVERITPSTAYLSTITGLVYGTQGVFNALGAPWWGRRNDRLGHRRNLLIAILCASLLYALHAAARAPWHLAVYRAALGFCLGGIQPVLYSLIARHSPAQQRGGVLGVAASFTTLGNAIGPMSGGVLGSLLGLRAVFLVASSVLLVNALLVRSTVNRSPDPAVRAA